MLVDVLNGLVIIGKDIKSKRSWMLFDDCKGIIHILVSKNRQDGSKDFLSHDLEHKKLVNLKRNLLEHQEELPQSKLER